jgi:hypothetical protein
MASAPAPLTFAPYATFSSFDPRHLSGVAEILPLTVVCSLYKGGIQGATMPIEREVLPVKVYVGDHGHVVINQPGYPGDDAHVVLHPHQVDLVIRWLQETKTDAISMMDEKDHAEERAQG